MSFNKAVFIKNVEWLLKSDLAKTFNERESFTAGEDLSLEKAVLFSQHFNISLDRLVSRDITNKKSDIKLLVMDVDGVLTEGGMYYTEKGDEFKRFHTRDGMAIKRLTKTGMQVAFLSSGINSNLVASRAKLLGVQRSYTGLDPKLGILEAWLNEVSVTWEQVGYIGDDVNDIEVMKLAGFTACPADATEKVKAIADVTLTRKGGDGCVRELIEEYFIEV
jgi:3-deoxy-D-manno-octulosonate 8-phosphate phosphatase (KDO 8-P phosphatase)